MRGIIILPQVRPQHPVSSQTDAIFDHRGNGYKQQDRDAEHPREDEDKWKSSPDLVYIVMKRIRDGQMSLNRHEGHVVSGHVQNDDGADLIEEQLTYNRVHKGHLGSNLLKYGDATSCEINKGLVNEEPVDGLPAKMLCAA